MTVNIFTILSYISIKALDVVTFLEWQITNRGLKTYSTAQPQAVKVYLEKLSSNAQREVINFVYEKDGIKGNISN